MDFQVAARLHRFGANREKTVNLATKVLYVGSHSGCVPAVSKSFADRPRISGSFLQRECKELEFFCLCVFPCK